MYDVLLHYVVVVVVVVAAAAAAAVAVATAVVTLLPTTKILRLVENVLLGQELRK